jgi:hypothetical protein
VYKQRKKDYSSTNDKYGGIMTQGTSQREHIYVYDTCSVCQESNVLVYELNDSLLCAEHYRDKTRLIKRATPCDKCGADNAVRDPSHRRNEYLCWSCHQENGFVVNDSVIKRAIVSLVNNFTRGTKIKCDAAGYGSDCDNNVKPRGPWGGRALCDTHGKTPPKPQKGTKS